MSTHPFDRGSASISSTSKRTHHQHDVSEWHYPVFFSSEMAERKRPQTTSFFFFFLKRAIMLQLVILCAFSLLVDNKFPHEPSSIAFLYNWKPLPSILTIMRHCWRINGESMAIPINLHFLLRCGYVSGLHDMTTGLHKGINRS